MYQLSLKKNKLESTMKRWHIAHKSTENLDSHLQRCHRYYPKFPDLYSRRINSLIITALKYMYLTEPYSLK